MFLAQLVLLLFYNLYDALLTSHLIAATVL